MDKNRNVKISKFLCLVLRHKPGTIGVELDESGWANVESLIKNSKIAGRHFDLELLEQVVETDNKNRFSFSENKDKIRANQGHSVKVNLGFEAQKPPKTLYHGTGSRLVDSIMKKGLDKRNRHHVHLSIDVETAVKVGKRHGEPFVFEVLAGQMYKDKFEFFLSENGVWLTDTVPEKYLKAIKV